MNLASRIEHTLLAPEATEKKIIKLCNEAKQYSFKSVCVNSCYVPLCTRELYGSGVKVGCVIGFPLGAMSTEAKVAETEYVIDNGAEEVDMVINIGYLKDKKDEFVIRDIAEVKNACNGKILKVILETCLLTDDEKIRACNLAVKAGATVSDVALMRKTVGSSCAVKASGGIRDYKTAIDMLNAGADTLGCSSGVAIMQEFLQNKMSEE